MVKFNQQRENLSELWSRSRRGMKSKSTTRACARKVLRKMNLNGKIAEAKSDPGESTHCPADRSERSAEKIGQAAPVTPAHRQLRSITHDDNILSMEPWLQLFDLLNVHERGSVNADEP